MLTTLLVKNMVCHRCVLAVEDILRNESIPFQKVIFGEIHLMDELSPDQKHRLIKRFGAVGFELIDNHSSALIEKIKQLINCENDIKIIGAQYSRNNDYLGAKCEDL